MPLEEQNDEFSSSVRQSWNIQISPVTKIAKLTPAFDEPSVSIYLSMPRTKQIS